MEASSGSVRKGKGKGKGKEKETGKKGNMWGNTQLVLKETEEVEGNVTPREEEMVHAKGKLGKLRKARQLLAKRELKMKMKEEMGIQETEDVEENMKQGKEMTQAKEKVDPMELEAKEETEQAEEAKEKEVDPKELEVKEEKGTEETEQAEEKLKPVEDEKMQEEDWKEEKQDCIARLKEKIALIRDDYKKVAKVWGEESAKAAYYDKMNYLEKTQLLSDLKKFSRRRKVSMAELNLDFLYEESISWELGGGVTSGEGEMDKEFNVEEMVEKLNSVEEWKLNPDEVEELEADLKGGKIINDGEPEKTFVSRYILGDYGLDFFLGGNFGRDNFKVRERTAEEVKDAEEREAKKQEEIRIQMEEQAKMYEECIELAKYLGEERVSDIYMDAAAANRIKVGEDLSNMTEEQRAKDHKEQQELKKKYKIQLSESQGFDIYDFPRRSGTCNLLVNEYYDPAAPHIAIACKKALALYNLQNGCDYQFVKVLKANGRVCAGYVYFITFQARRRSDDSSIVFQTRVFEGVGPKINRTHRVDFCRLKKWMKLAG